MYVHVDNVTTFGTHLTCLMYVRKNDSMFMATS